MRTCTLAHIHTNGSLYIRGSGLLGKHKIELDWSKIAFHEVASHITSHEVRLGGIKVQIKCHTMSRHAHET